MSVFGHMMEQEEKKIAILWKALEFYADPEVYDRERGWIDGVPIDQDLGARAREAFKEINDLPLW